MYTSQESQVRNKAYQGNQTLNIGLQFLELKYIDIMQTMEYFLNNCS